LLRSDGWIDVNSDHQTLNPGANQTIVRDADFIVLVACMHDTRELTAQDGE